MPKRSVKIFAIVNNILQGESEGEEKIYEARVENNPSTFQLLLACAKAEVMIIFSLIKWIISAKYQY